MHEYSIVQTMLVGLDREARAMDATKVTRLSVRIGNLSGVEIDLLRSAFQTFRDQTTCAGVDLEITLVYRGQIRNGLKLVPHY